MSTATMPITSEPLQENMQLPIPKGWSLLVRMMKTQEVSRGGIFIPQSRVADENIANLMAEVVGMGPDAYCRAEMFPGGPRCGVGDVIMFQSYTGIRFNIGKGDGAQEYRLIADDDVKAIVPDPSVIWRNL